MEKGQSDIRRFLEELSHSDSESALKFLYYTYADRIMRYIYMYVKCHEAAEELVSDVFYAVWERRKMMHEIKDFEAYIYRIAKFKSLNYLRENRPEFINLDDVPVDLFACTETTPEDDLISQELVNRLNEAIERLPAKCKIAFKLVREDGMKYREAAEHMGISVKTLEAHLTAATKQIAQLLLPFS